MTAIPAPTPIVEPVDPSTCGSCGSRIISTGIETYCSGCGAVLDSLPVVSLPIFDSSRRSNGEQLPSQGPATRIGGRKSELRQLRWTERRFIRSTKEQEEAARRDVALRVANLLGLPAALHEDVVRVVEAARHGGGTREGVAAVAAFEIARRTGIPMSPRQVARKLGLRHRVFCRTLRRLRPYLPAEGVRRGTITERIADTAAASLELPPELRRYVREAARRLADEAVNAAPRTVACYILAKVRAERPDLALTVRAIAGYTAVSEVTLRSAVHSLDPKFGSVLGPVPGSTSKVVEPAVAPEATDGPPVSSVPPTKCVLCRRKISSPLSRGVGSSPVISFFVYLQPRQGKVTSRVSGLYAHKRCLVLPDGTRFVDDQGKPLEFVRPSGGHRAGPGRRSA